MSYATQADLVTRFSEAELIQLTDRNPAATAIDTDVLQRAIEDADAEIDARLQARFTLPLATVPRLIVNIACDIARYRLYDDRCPEHVQKRYDQALKLIDQIGRGDLEVGLDATAQTPQDTGGPAFQANDRTFSASLLADYTGGA